MKAGSTQTDGSTSDRTGARIIAIANQKGGVGKSTTAVSLGAALAELGFRVLVVDLDPQGNASTGLGIRHEARSVTVYDVLAAEAPIQGAIVSTQVSGLDVIPSTIDLAGAEIELVSQFSRELRLRRAMEPLRDGAYDFVFLDCPPSLGLLTINALAAAEELIVPIQCEYYALEGLGQLLRNVRLVQQNVNPRLKLTGIVMTMFDTRTRLSEQVVEEVQRFFGDRVYGVLIPRTVRLSEAPGFGQPITLYDPRSKGAESYRALAKEVAEREPPTEPMPVLDELPSVILPLPEENARGEAALPPSVPDVDLEEWAKVPSQAIHADVDVMGQAEAADHAEVEEGAKLEDRGRFEGEGYATEEPAAAVEDTARERRAIEAEAPAADDAPVRGRRGERPASRGPAQVEPAPGRAPFRATEQGDAGPRARRAPTVVVIDEDEILPGEEAERPPSHAGAEEGPDSSLAEVGETLPREQPRRRRWRLFRRRGDEG